MNLHRLRQWFALPDAVRSPWKRRMVWGGVFVLVLASVVAWRASRPALGEDVKLVNVSREEAELMVEKIRRTNRDALFSLLRSGHLKLWFDHIRPEKVLSVEVEDNCFGKVRTFVRSDYGREYLFYRETNRWRLKSVGINTDLR